MKSDLHFHSTNSDGNKTPDERIAQIRSIDPKNEGVWALTDHDRFSPNFVIPARDAGIQAVWATEISAHSDEIGLSLHITCYASTLSSRIAEVVSRIMTGRKVKILGQIQKLNERGVHIDKDDFFQWVENERMSPDSATNYHIAQYIWKNRENRQAIESQTGGSLVSDEGEKSMLAFMKECLRENGDFAHIGYYKIPPYEPEISELVGIARQEGIILSVAHPNFSFTKKLNRDFGAKSRQQRVEAFQRHIVPALSDVGIRNYEINALASSEWVGAIANTVERVGGIITFGSDNHGLAQADSKHGVFGEQNPLLTKDMRKPIEYQLQGIVRERTL